MILISEREQQAGLLEDIWMLLWLDFNSSVTSYHLQDGKKCQSKYLILAYRHSLQWPGSYSTREVWLPLYSFPHTLCFQVPCFCSDSSLIFIRTFQIFFANLSYLSGIVGLNFPSSTTSSLATLLATGLSCPLLLIDCLEIPLLS